MVVANKSDFGEVNSQLESSTSSTKCSDCFGAFTNCDSRGMLKLNQDLLINKEDIKTLFRIDKGEPFATGLYAQVKRCKSLSNNSYYAAKFCPRKRPGQSVDEECIENLHEIALLSQLKHPYIITFIDAFILEDCAVTIMELAPGGDLQTVIDADLVLLEIDASRYIFQLLEALKYLHDRHVAHLDIKPQNLLLMGEFPNCDIKLCDFEISRVIKPGKEVKEILGTPDYVAPEILLYENINLSADMWSVGILCYVLLTGFSPFGGDTDQETFRNIVHEPIDFPDELFEDISPSAIDLIIKLAVKNPKLRPTPAEMEEHDWLKSFISEIPPPSPPSEPEPEPEMTYTVNHTGPRKRSPRKTAALPGLSTASASGRRPSARAILRACKSAYDLNKMGGKTKSREALVEKMRASGENSVGGNWKLRKNLSKSREQLWESKIQLSKSCEKITNNLPGSTRWASISNFPSLDLGMKCSTSQESVISVVSNCTSAAVNPQEQFLDWNPQSIANYDQDFPIRPQTQPHPSISVPNTPPIPNFDLSAPVNHNFIDSSSNSGGHLPLTSDYPSLVTEMEEEETTATTVVDIEENGVTSGEMSPSSSAVGDAESQKSVAELIMTFGGRVPNGNPNTAKKLDLKNQFEPILEVDGSEEATISLGNCSSSSSGSDNNSSSVIPTGFKDKDKEPKSAESGHFSMNSSTSTESSSSRSTSTSTAKCECDGVLSNKRVSRSSQQIRDEMRAARINARNGNGDHNHSQSYHHPTQSHSVSPRRGSISPPKHIYENGVRPGQMGTGLRGILKKPATIVSNKIDPSLYHRHHLNGNSLILPHHSNHPSSGPSSRRGSIPGNCTRLYDTHTISSLAKVPKKSILKNSTNIGGGDIKTNRSSSTDNGSSTSTSSNFNRKPSGERVNSKSPENIVTTSKESSPGTGDFDRHQKSSSPDTTSDALTSTISTSSATGSSGANTSKAVGNKGKVIPKGLSPRQSPSFILLNDVSVKPKVRKPLPKPSTTSSNNSNTSNSPAQRSNTTYRTPATRSKRVPPTNPPAPTPRAPVKPRTSIREQILRRKMPEKSDRGPTVTVHLPPTRIRINMTDTTTNTTITTNTILSNKIINKISPPASPPLSPTREEMPKLSVSVPNPIKSSKFKSELSIEPAAVAIKIFPPDPAIIPKSIHLTKGNLSQSQNFEENNNTGNDSNNNCGSGSRGRSPSNNLDINPMDSLTISNNNANNLEIGKSPEMRQKSKQLEGNGNGNNKTSDKFTWGVVCTGSIGRAMERFETGSIRGKKLRRGSVPDF